MSGIVLLEPMAAGSPAHNAQGQDSRRFLLEKTLEWPSLHSIFTCDSLSETVLGKGKNPRIRSLSSYKAWLRQADIEPTPFIGKGYLHLSDAKFVLRWQSYPKRQCGF